MVDIAPNIEHYIGYNNISLKFRHIFRFNCNVSKVQLDNIINKVDLNNSTISGHDIVELFNKQNY